jgi:hypothetical protein
MTPQQQRLRKLMERAVLIGAQFPEAEDIDVDNEAEVAEVRMLLREHSKVVAEIDKILAQARGR